MTAIRRRKRVTKARADRVIAAIAELLECDDFREYASAIREMNVVSDLDRAANLARAIRDEVPR